MGAGICTQSAGLQGGCVHFSAPIPTTRASLKGQAVQKVMGGRGGLAGADGKSGACDGGQLAPLGPRRTKAEKHKNRRRIRKMKGWGKEEREGSREGKNDRKNDFL